MSESSERKYNVRDYMLLPEGFPYQLINRDLVIALSPKTYRQIILINLLKEITNFVKVLLISFLKIFPDQLKVRSEFI